MEDFPLQSAVSQDVYQKLKQANINTALLFLVTNSLELAKIVDSNEEEVEKIKFDIAKTIHKPNTIIKASAVNSWKRLKTGCNNIDAVLKNGVPLGLITEIYGCSGVGKTQLCLQLALQVQLPIDMDGLGKGAVYICTEGVFPSQRLHQLANVFRSKYNCPNKNFEDSVFLKHVSVVAELQHCLSVELQLLLRRENIGLIIVDSIAGPFRSDNVREYAMRSRDLIGIAHKLNEIANEHNIAIVCTNQVLDDIENNKVEPCLGIAWSNSLNYRCQILRSNDNSLREFEIVFSPDLLRQKCCFSVTEEGLI
ncbi:unnamed protein product [Phyllotreta striolata]|uniref:RecA family profile 1 domain-containing protein n=1 Tax=Phyllotreta striolata TaxID=444603 RepID=A0A9N9TQK0_PHYSR|nr:unnamed protein product [Phyllotreta striolata]